MLPEGFLEAVMAESARREALLPQPRPENELDFDATRCFWEAWIHVAKDWPQVGWDANGSPVQ